MYNNGIIEGNVDVRDVQKALGTSKHYWNELCAHQNINPMSKYKPVRYEKIGQLTEAEFIDARYGLRPKYNESGQDYYTFPSNNPNPDAAWVYEKPRGKSDGTTGHRLDEWYRITDFYHYFSKATPPLAIDVTGELGNSVGVSFFIDQVAATHYGGSWDDEYNLKFADVFYPTQTPGYDSHLCVCIHNLKKNQHCTVVSKSTVRELNPYSDNTILMFPEGTPWTDGYHPAVPMLSEQSADNGDVFRFIVGLRNSYTGGSNLYEVLTESVFVYPLAFKEGIDRKDVALYSIYDLSGLECYFTGSVSAEYTGEVTYNGQSMYRYRITGTLTGKFTTPSRWGVGRVTGVTVKMTIRTQGFVGDNDLNTVGVAVDIPMADHTYNNVHLVTFGANNKEVFVYIYKGVGTKSLEFYGTAEYASEKISFMESKIFTF